MERQMKHEELDRFFEIQDYIKKKALNIFDEYWSGMKSAETCVAIERLDDGKIHLGFTLSWSSGGGEDFIVVPESKFLEWEEK